MHSLCKGVIMGLGFAFASNFGSAIDAADMAPIADGAIFVGAGLSAPVVVTGSPTLSGDVIIQGKQDIGVPGTGGGLDIGEGGSYSTDAAGVTIVRAFSYDASAPSGSRFTELTLTDQNTLLGDAGDRIYIGSPHKHWAPRLQIGVAKSTEVMLASYWDGSSLRAVTFMGILKDSVTALGTGILEQTAEQEYITIDHHADDDWVAVDDQLDAIPNTGTALFWMCLEVPGGGLATPPRIDDIKTRGTDADFTTGASQLVFWGKARVELHTVIGSYHERAAAQPKLVDISWSAGTLVPLFELRNNQDDGVDLIFKLPKGIDTSSKLIVTLDWFSTDSGEVNFDLVCKASVQGTVIGVAESDTATTSTSITPSAANQLQQDTDLVGTSQIDISALDVDDNIAFTLIRRGTADANSGNVYPINLIVHHTQWTAGEHV